MRFERPEAGELRRPTPTIAVVADDDVGVTDVALAVDGVPAGALPWLPDLGVYAAVWDARAIAPGPHTLEVQVGDAAGNRATANIVLVVPAGFARAPGTTSRAAATPPPG